MLECAKKKRKRNQGKIKKSTPGPRLSGTKWNWACQTRHKDAARRPRTQCRRLLSPFPKNCGLATQQAAILGPLPFILNGGPRPSGYPTVCPNSPPPLEGLSEGSSSFGPLQIFFLGAYFMYPHLFINISHPCDQSPPRRAPVWLIASPLTHSVLDFVRPTHWALSAGCAAG